MSEEAPSSYLAPHAEGRLDALREHRFVIAKRAIKSGELIAVFGGSVLTGRHLRSLGPAGRRVSLQVGEDQYLVSTHEGPADWINHSCDPNAGLLGQVMLVALRPIARGEEICFDYAMSDGSSYDEFSCDCGSRHCRGWVRGDDWRRSDLRHRYAGYFSPYLQRRIESLEPADCPHNGSAPELTTPALQFHGSLA